MAATGIVNRSPYGLACGECNELVIAPERSHYVDNREVHHFWACENCGHEIEITVNLRTIAISTPTNSVSLGA
jgi:ABC-type ATPase with predicted acetyltransferase domain